MSDFIDTIPKGVPCRLPCDPAEADAFIATPGPAVLEEVRGWTGTVLVLGAGGKMGFHLSWMLKRALEATGAAAELAAVSRFGSADSRKAFTEAGIPLIAGDLRDPEFLARLPDADIVFFLAGAKFGTAGNPGLLEEMNVRLPRKVAARFRGSRMVAFSTGCVYAYVPPESGGSTEESPTEPVGAYARSCLEREQAFAGESRESGTPVVLIRLNYAVEFRYGVLVDICSRVLAGQPVDLEMGYLNLIWQGDALDQIIRSVPLAGSPAVPLNITGPEILRVRDLATACGRLAGKPVTFRGTEAPTAWLNNAGRSHRLFGEPPTRLPSILEWTVAWLMQGGKTLGKPTGFERRDGQF